jgi:malonate decarboxylase gamma subunit
VKQQNKVSRARTWFEVLAGGTSSSIVELGSVAVADGNLGNEIVRFLSVIPNPHNRYPMARNGEMGIEEAWRIAKYVYQVIATDERGRKRPIVAIVDIPSQAYGALEEALGIHLACAAAANAYARARIVGHPVIALVVGSALAGAFLAHGYQANLILAIDSPGVTIHAMGKQAAARITRSSVTELDKLADEVIPMSYDLHTYAELGVLYKLIGDVNADAPRSGEIELVRQELIEAIEAARLGPRDLSNRLLSPGALRTRKASREVRQRLTEQWTVLSQTPKLASEPHL